MRERPIVISPASSRFTFHVHELMPIDPTTFRDLMRRWASGVTVVTCGAQGRVHGMTASSFSSLSLDPPLALVCVGKGKLTHALLEQQGTFGIHILGAGQRDLSDRCAGF